ncbi:MAG: fibronectin type III domain-containing protein [Patescibacteria group bacterium]
MMKKTIRLVIIGFILVYLLATVITVQAADITVSSNKIGVTTRYIGAVEASSGFDVADLQGAGINCYRIYAGMSRLEKTDDDGVYGSPAIDQIKADPNVINWAAWDTVMRAKDNYTWTNSPLPVSFEDIISGCKSIGVEPVITVRNRDNFGNPSWSPDPPVTAADWNEWWEHVFATVYWLNVRNNYGCKFWEIHNEPDNGNQGWGHGLAPYYTFVQYTADAINTACALAGIQPYILAPVCQNKDTNWINAVLDNVDSHFNVVDYHCYDRSSQSYAATVHTSVRTHNPDGFIEPIFNSEWGTYRSSYNSVSAALTYATMVWEMCQPATYVFGHTIFSLYSWTGDTFDGLILQNGTKTYTYYAYGTICRGLQGGRDMYAFTNSDTSIKVAATKDADGFYLTIINSNSGAKTINANIGAHVTNGTANLYAFSASHQNTLMGTAQVSGGQLSFTAPGSSIVVAQVAAGGGGDTQAPTAPANLTATAVSSGRIDLSWTASTDNVGVTGYKVFRGGVEIDTVTGTTYQDTGLSPSTTYNYYVKAFDAAGNISAQSNTAQATTQQSGGDTQAPTAPANLTATAVSSSQINLSWTASTDNVGVTGYQVFRNGEQVGTSGTTSYADTGLTPNTTYSYYVKAYDAAGNVSTQSNTAQATTLPAGGGSTVMHVESIWSCDASGNPKEIFTKAADNYMWRVKIFDGNGAPVAGASVTSRLYRPGNYPTQVWQTFTATTDANGTAAFAKGSKSNDTTGYYTMDVSAVTKSGMTWDTSADDMETDTLYMQ